MLIRPRLAQSAVHLLLCSTLACPQSRPPNIPSGPVAVELQTVASGLVAPNYLTSAGDGSGRLFIVDQVGTIRLVKAGQLVDHPFLDIHDRLVALNPSYDERGLLGLAFHPGFADASSPGFHRLYTYHTAPVSGPGDFTVPLPQGVSFNHQNVVTEWQVSADDPDLVDPATAREIVRIDHPQSNHSAGQLAFGHDGLLYIGVGDGGGANDTAAGHSRQGNGQDTSNVLGDILRIDPLPPDLTGDNVGPVSDNGRYRIPADNPFITAGGIREIFAYGFRNPFRFSFDPQTGDLLAGDVGQREIEEIDIVVRGGNYGWPLKEGSFAFDRATGAISEDTSGLPADLVDPILQYDHSEGEAVIGGFVYRGQAIADLAGQYVFGDFMRGPAGRLFHAPPEPGQIRELIIGEDNRSLGLFVKGFGRDEQGELYVLAGATAGPSGTSGVALKLVPLALPQEPGPDPDPPTGGILSSCFAPTAALLLAGTALLLHRRD